MEAKELFNKKTFTDLFSIIDEFDREIEYSSLLAHAKEIKMEKQFKKLYEKFEKDINKNKMVFDNELKLPKCKYDLSDYNMGKYRCTTKGIVDNQNNKFSFFPVLPVERYINDGDGKEKVKLIFYKEKKWNELIVDKSEIAISQKLLKLSDYGLDVNSENVGHYIKYFAEILNLNDIIKLDSVSHLGWNGNDFVPYDKDTIFDGAESFRPIYKAIKTKGDYQVWHDTVAELRKDETIRLIMATTFASPLIEKLSIQPYMVNVWSALSGNGKTLTCMLAMSAWGNPNTGALRLSSNNTQNYYVTVASFMKNITCYFDELQIVKKNKHFDLESLVMDLSGQTEKGRLNKNSKAREVKTWHCNFLFTNNDRMVKENAGEQVYNRVIDMEIGKQIIKDGNKIATIIKNNYGFAGKKYIEHIKKVGWDKIQDRYNEIFNQILAETKSTDKQASSLASLLLADELICDSLFPNVPYLGIKSVTELVNDKDDIKTSVKAKNFILGLINVNHKKFDEYGYGEIWGMKTQFQCKISTLIIERELRKAGFEFDTIKKEWAETRFLEVNSQGRYTHNTTVRAEKGSYVILNLEGEDNE
jgi:uncharacterized protein (DUF927 family)